MEIIIVGCGKVGFTLAERLTIEGHNVCVIDKDPLTVTRVTSDLDVMGFIGNGVSFATLQEAGLERTDLLIAVTGSDEQNLLICAIAKKGRNCKTIARVRGYVYNSEIEFLKREFGLAMIINPEMASAAEMTRIFRFPSATKIETFSKGKVELIHFTVKPGSVAIGMSLVEMRMKFKARVLVCLATRKGEVIIPKGGFTFEEGDQIAVVAETAQAQKFFKHLGLETRHVDNVILVGGGKISYYLAKGLIDAGIAVKIIEISKQRCEELTTLLPEADIIYGDGTDQTLLLEEGLEQADGFIALTDMDEENLILSLFAQSNSKAKVVTKINRMKLTGLADQLALETIVYPKMLTADYIVQFARSMQASIGGSMEYLYMLSDGDAEAMEFQVKEPSGVTNVPFETLKLKPNTIVCCINRGGKVIIPGGKDTIQVGDNVIIVAAGYRVQNITDILGGE